MTKYGDKPWQFGTVDGKLFVIYGGSYEDTSRSALIKNIMGNGSSVTKGISQDTVTQSVYEHNFLNSVSNIQNEFDIITEEYLDIFRHCTTEASVELDDDSTYALVTGHLHIAWEDADWILPPTRDTIIHAIAELIDYGIEWVHNRS